MVFSSFEFLFVFLPLCLLSILFFYNKNKILNYSLLVFSIYFYIAGESWYTLVLFFTALMNYFLALKVENSNTSRKPIVFSIIANLGILIYFKYSGFFLEIFNISNPGIHLPLGISFFIFQGMSYVIDAYRKDIRPTRSFSDFFMYLALFPQLVAGPIVRYSDIEKEIKVKNYDFVSGIEKFVLGLAKKVLIADQVSFYADFAFGVNGAGNSSVAWIGIICYTLQIYFDFSGYSDMAIGLGRILGFRFLENFNYPYISASIQEFWRRWHMSLSAWFRDYLYIPLGGNRYGAGRTYLNQFIVFGLCGFWHGASWNFIVWGLYHGSLLTVEKFFGLSEIFRRIKFLGHIYTVLMIMIGWVFFRAENLEKAIEYLKVLFLFEFRSVELSDALFVVIIIGGILSTPIGSNLFTKVSDKLKIILLISIFIFCTIILSIQGQSPFIYFRF